MYLNNMIQNTVITDITSDSRNGQQSYYPGENMVVGADNLMWTFG